jgi:hypothetical protein
MRADNAQTEDPNAALEQSLIKEFLRAHEQTFQPADVRPEADAAALLKAAIDFASLRLAEIQARAQHVEEIHRTS